MAQTKKISQDLRETDVNQGTKSYKTISEVFGLH